MNLSIAKDLFLTLLKDFFDDTTLVINAKQNRTPKPNGSLVVVDYGNPHRHQFANNSVNEDNELISNYLTRVSVTIDLFSHGAEVIDDDDGTVLGYDDDTVDKLLSFCNFLNSSYAVQWCHKNDVSILVDGDVQHLTGLINDTSYEYRSRITVFYYYTQRTIGDRAEEVL